MSVNYKLGKLPAIYDSRTLKFSNYLKANLPAPPPSVEYGNKVKSWPMFGNDKYGDCTCAAAGHMIQDWTANSGKLATPTLSSVIKFYEHFVGDPPPADAGCNMLDVLNYWRTTGLGSHKVEAFVALEPKNDVHARDAIYMFGALYIGVELPDFAVTGNMLKTPWVVPPQGPVGDAAPNPNNGHCIPAVAYDARNLYIVTWGEVKAMSWQFYDTYADEAYAVLSQEFIAKNGKTVAGFDFATLKKDLASISSSSPAFATIFKRGTR